MLCRASIKPPGPSAAWLLISPLSLLTSSAISLDKFAPIHISNILKYDRDKGVLDATERLIRRLNERNIYSYGFVIFLKSSQTPWEYIVSIWFLTRRICDIIGLYNQVSNLKSDAFFTLKLILSIGGPPLQNTHGGRDAIFLCSITLRCKLSLAFKIFSKTRLFPDCTGQCRS